MSWLQKIVFLLVIVLEIIIISILVLDIIEIKSGDNVLNIITDSKNEVIYPKDENIEMVKNIIKQENKIDNKIYNVSISAVGDLMVHKWQLDDAYNKNANEYDFNYSFEYVKKYLEKSDITIGNLETVFGGYEEVYSDYPMFNTPDSFALAIKNAGFDILTTANNHSNDRKKNGVLRTIKILDELGIEHFGTYSSQEERDNIFIKEINNIKFAFLSYTYGTNGILMPKGEEYLINVMSEKLIKSDIEKAKALNPDFIIILPHMGNEYELMPKEVFKNWAYFMIECGGDIILASHPHVLQPAEFVEIDRGNGIETSFIAYSLGNFISSQRTVPRDAGVILTLNFKKTGNGKASLETVSYIPTWVKFVDIKGAYDITVISVFEGLKDGNLNLRSKDINRLKTIHLETNKNFLNKSIPIDEVETSYNIEKNIENTVIVNCK